MFNFNLDDIKLHFSNPQYDLEIKKVNMYIPNRFALTAIFCPLKERNK